MKKAKNGKRALVIISDGGDNNSRYSEYEVKKVLRESDVLVYSVYARSLSIRATATCWATHPPIRRVTGARCRSR